MSKLSIRLLVTGLNNFLAQYGMEIILDTLVELKDISVTSKGTEIIKHIDYSFQKGKIYGIVAANGVGKTTLMKVILGILTPDHGDVVYQGCKDIRYAIDNELLFKNMSAKEILTYYAMLLGVKNEGIIDRILKKTGLYDERHKLVRKYSSGMKQRLSFGLVMLGKSDLIVLDEIMNGLDVVANQYFSEEIRNMATVNGSAIILSDHHGEYIYNLCDEFVFLRFGEICRCVGKNQLEIEFGRDTDNIKSYFYRFINGEISE